MGVNQHRLRAWHAAPKARIVATHMDAINHMGQTREELKAYVAEKGIKDRVDIPEDGATLISPGAFQQSRPGAAIQRLRVLGQFARFQLNILSTNKPAAVQVLFEHSMTTHAS